MSTSETIDTTYNWLTDILPLEILAKIIPYCAIELLSVDKFIHEYIIENALLCEDVRFMKKRPVRSWASESMYGILKRNNVNIDGITSHVNKLTPLEMSIVMQSLPILKMILSHPSTNLCQQKSRPLQLALQFNRSESMRLLSQHPTFVNAMTGIAKERIHTHMLTCDVETFNALFSGNSKLKPRAEYWEAALSDVNIPYLAKCDVLLDWYSNHPDKKIEFVVSKFMFSDRLLKGDIFKSILVKRPNYNVSGYDNSLLRMYFKEKIYHMYGIEPNDVDVPFVRNIVEHPLFTWKVTGIGAIGHILACSESNPHLLQVLIDSLNPLDVCIPQLIVDVSKQRAIHVLPKLFERFPDSFNFVSFDDIRRGMEGSAHGAWPSISFWISRGYMPSVPYMTQNLMYLNFESVASKPDFPAVQMMQNINAMNHLTFSNSASRRNPTGTEYGILNLLNILKHPSIQFERDIQPLVQKIIKDYDKEGVKILSLLVKEDLFDPTWDNFYFVKMVWQIDTGYAYEKFCAMLTSTKMRRAQMRKDFIYDEISQTISFRVKPLQ